MKALLIIVTALATSSSVAQPGSQELKPGTETVGRARGGSSFARTAKPSEPVIRRVIYSGAAATVGKAGNPLQLLNPLAPAKYGSGENNVIRDPPTGNATGLKIFCVEF